MRRPRGHRHTAAILIALSGAGWAVGDEPRGAFTLVRHADRFTIRAEDVPLSRALEDVARAVGAEVRGEIPAREITASMDELPLAEVLVRLLAGENFTLAYGADGKLRTVELLGGPRSSPAAGVPATPPGAPQGAERPSSGNTVRVSSRLGAALGTRTPPATDVIHAAFHQKSARLRADAQKSALAALEADPQFERVLAAIFGAVDDETLVQIFRGWGRARAARFLGRLVASSRSEELRVKAAAVLTGVRRPGGSA
jgi:hypothetical protein